MLELIGSLTIAVAALVVLYFGAHGVAFAWFCFQDWKDKLNERR